MDTNQIKPPEGFVLDQPQIPPPQGFIVDKVKAPVQRVPIEPAKKPGLGEIILDTLKGAGQDLVDTGKRVGEVSAATMTGMGGFMTSPLVGWAGRLSGLDPELAKEAKHEYMESVAYHPKDEKAQAMTRAALKPFELYEPMRASLIKTLKAPFKAYTGIEISDADAENLFDTAVVAIPALKSYLKGKVQAGQKPNPKQ